MILELKGQGFKELVAVGEKSLLKSCNTEEGTWADNSASKWEKGQGTECPDGTSKTFGWEHTRDDYAC